jgi:hypothetical protein
VAKEPVHPARRLTAMGSFPLMTGFPFFPDLNPGHLHSFEVFFWKSFFSLDSSFSQKICQEKKSPHRKYFFPPSNVQVIRILINKKIHNSLRLTNIVAVKIRGLFEGILPCR